MVLLQKKYNLWAVKLLRRSEVEKGKFIKVWLEREIKGMHVPAAKINCIID